jgi:heme-binding protein
VEAACYDCHSNETRRPWYSKIAPGSWLLERDVRAGREKLNFSEMNREDNELDKAAETVAEDEMPPFRYKLLHKDARLRPSDREALIRGLQQSLPAEQENKHRS